MSDPFWHQSVRLVVPGAVALATGTVATWLVRAAARRLGIVNQPNPLVPQHTRPVAYLGGVGVGIGVACGLLALHAMFPSALPALGLPIVSILIPSALYLILGVADDLIAFSPARKFVLQAFVAALAVVLGAWSPLTGLDLVDRAAAWFWIMTLVNAFNLTDVCDGLLGSLSAVIFAFIALQYPTVASSAVVLAASCCGFLVFNKPPATIFLGDAGSHLLGAFAAFLILAGIRQSSADAVARLLPAMLLVGVPLFELAFLTVVRTRKGLAWWRGSPDHFSLRLQAGGFTRLQTDQIACAVAAAFGGTALAVPGSSPLVRTVILALMVAVALLAARQLLRWEVKPKAKPNRTAGDAIAAAE